jgi:hypothetical protein
LTKEDAALARRALFAAVEGGDHNDDSASLDDDDGNNDAPLYSTKLFLRLFVSGDTNTSSRYCLRPGISAREQRQILRNTLKSNFDRGHARRFFSSLKNLVCQVIDKQEYVPGGIEDDDYEADKINSDVDVKCSEALKFLLHATETVQAYVDGLCDKQENKQAQLSIFTEVYEVALNLHDILCNLCNYCSRVDAAVATRQKIVTLCETWWLNNGSLRESLILNALLLLVQAALEKDGGVAGPRSRGSSTLNDENHIKTAAIKRLFHMRSAIDVIDFADPESSDFRLLLLRVASSPSCLRTVEGKRFLAYLFHTDTTLMDSIYIVQQQKVRRVNSTKRIGLTILLWL